MAWCHYCVEFKECESLPIDIPDGEGGFMTDHAWVCDGCSDDPYTEPKHE